MVAPPDARRWPLDIRSVVPSRFVVNRSPRESNLVMKGCDRRLNPGSCGADVPIHHVTQHATKRKAGGVLLCNKADHAVLYISLCKRLPLSAADDVQPFTLVRQIPFSFLIEQHRHVDLPFAICPAIGRAAKRFMLISDKVKQTPGLQVPGEDGDEVDRNHVLVGVVW